MTTLKNALILFIFFLSGYTATGQTEGVSIKNNPSAPHASAMLDVESSTKGMLIPRVALTALNSSSPIATTPTTSLLVYNTTSNTAVTPGFYYWESGGWKKLGDGLWSKVASTNDIEYFNGNVRVGNATSTTSPVYDFEVQSGTGNVYSCLFQNRGEQLRWGYNDYAGESGAGPGNVLVQKTANNSGSFLPMRYVQLYETSDYGFGVTSYGKASGSTGLTEMDITKNNFLVKASTGNIDLDAKGNISLTSGGTIQANIPGGSFVLSMGGSWTPVSDSTLKKNIVNEPSVLPKLMQCRAVKYNLKADQTNTLIHGFIAQEFESIFPELISSINIYDKDSSGNKLQTYQTKKGIGYSGLISVLVKAVQEQQAQIDDLKTRVLVLEAK